MRAPHSLLVCLAILAAAGNGPDAHGDESREDPAVAPWRALEDPGTSRKRVLAMFRAAKTPDKSAISVLERMVKEDEAHKAPSVPLADLPEAERLAELIWRLRDQSSIHSISANGGPPSLFALGGQDPTICDRIAAFGHKAIPRLLEHLQDDRFTRVVVSRSRADWRPRGTLRIGYLARAIIERIADRPFPVETQADGTNNADALFRGWWQAVQTKGEFLATADEMDRTTGKYRAWATYLAARLLRINEGAAAPLVVRACRAEKDVLVRKAFLDLLETAKGEGVVEFLRQELAQGPMLLHRVTAAFILRERALFDPTKAMRAEWKALRDHGKPWPSTHEQWCVDGGVATLAVFLASSGKEGVASLVEGLAGRPARTRGLVAQVLGVDRVEDHLYGYLGKLRIQAAPEPPAQATEAALRAMLDDLERIGKHAIYAPGPKDARVADLAAHSLARRFPGRYTFSLGAPKAARDAALAAMRR